MINGNTYFESHDELEHLAASIDKQINLIEKKNIELSDQVRREFKNDLEKFSDELNNIKFDIEFLTWKLNLSWWKKHFSTFKNFTKSQYLFWKNGK